MTSTWIGGKSSIWPVPDNWDGGVPQDGGEMVIPDHRPGPAAPAGMTAGKALAFSKALEESVLAGEPDPALDALVARSIAAQQSISGWHEDKVDDLITALATEIAGHADELAAATVAETGIGCVTDKAHKNRFASLDVAHSLVGKPGVGIIGSGEQGALTEIADPMGVVLGLIPMTNPVATLVFKTLICIKARDALIVSCHRDAAAVGAMTVDLLRHTLRRHGASADLVQTVPRRPTRQATAALMHHPGVSMILATGGTAMVKAAYSSGTPAIGVGSGNAPASRILVNGPGAHGCIGLGNGLIPSLTLGCGTYGRTSTTDNVTYTNLVNIKRVAHPLTGTGTAPPPDLED